MLQRILPRRIKGEGSLRGGSKTLTPTVTHKDPAGITSILDGAVVDFRAFKVHVFGKSAHHHTSTFPAPEGDNLSYGPKFLEQLRNCVRVEEGSARVLWGGAKGTLGPQCKTATFSKLL